MFRDLLHRHVGFPQKGKRMLKPETVEVHPRGKSHRRTEMRIQRGPVNAEFPRQNFHCRPGIPHGFVRKDKKAFHKSFSGLAFIGSPRESKYFRRNRKSMTLGVRRMFPHQHFQFKKQIHRTLARINRLPRIAVRFNKRLGGGTVKRKPAITPLMPRITGTMTMILMRQMMKCLARMKNHRPVRKLDLSRPLNAPEKLNKRLFLFRFELAPAEFSFIVTGGTDMHRHRKFRQNIRIRTAYDFPHNSPLSSNSAQFHRFLHCLLAI